ncbi:MAG: glutathione transferase GstA [Lysobacterales bacterium 69-70]|nr:glutathione transferase GstA [Xanthomonadaceae bacterium]ODU35838.1 MAG: glutathione transferase GstA [Xanthomonadaceae bacterium SCN 69-320]ODV17428.1 MAG: glutathione transferase GstA [Xanthomonadaceae bacterium SCN 69-25]OJY97324.1 MAG: glutathione transferase GstA [Xanthomonadales bacterium 69-70]
MKLYFSPGACSLSPHIVLREAGLPFEAVKVDLATKQTADGADFKAINPKGYVPALQLDDGRVLTEGPAIVQYLADQVPAKQLAPANGSWERYRLQEWLNFISTEIHKQFSPLFNAAIPDTVKDLQKAKLAQRFGEIAPVLEKQDYLTGSQFSVADAYLFTVLGWSKYFQIDLQQWPSIARFVERVAARPAVAEALDVEAKAKKIA